MGEGVVPNKDLLDVEDVARYLDVGTVTVWRWCREGNLPCLKVGRSWRIRRAALEEFLERKERSETLVGRLRTFLEVPDNVLAIAQTLELMHRLDAAFFKVGEARDATMVKYHSGESKGALDELRADLGRNGLEVERLEEEGRLRFIAESDPPGERMEELRGLLEEERDNGRILWIDFDWERRIDLDAVLKQQQAMTEFVENSRCVIKTGMLERELDEWPGSDLRRAQVLHSATVWFSKNGLALSRVTPPPGL